MPVKWILLPAAAVAITVLAGRAGGGQEPEPGHDGGIWSFAELAARIGKDPSGQAGGRLLVASGSHASLSVVKGKAALKRHRHNRHDEVVYVVQGRGSFSLGCAAPKKCPGLTRMVGPGDVLLIPAGVPHSLDPETEIQALVVNGPRQDPAQPDREFLPKW